MKRYFLVAYSATTIPCNTAIFGSLEVESTTFPSKPFLLSEIERTPNLKSPVLLNFFEFQSENDYQDYKAAA